MDNFKKTFFSMITMILMIVAVAGIVSAFEFDNSLRYEEQDMKVIFENACIPLIDICFGEDIGEARLKSHNNVNQIKEVAAGNSVTMWYEFDKFKDKYLDGLGEVYFTDQKTGEVVERDFKFVYLATEQRERDIYGQGECITNANGTNCEEIVVGVEKYEWEGWLPYNSKDIPKEKIIIGIETFVELNDHVDGVWEIVGQKVKKHASWIQDNNVNLISYYRLENDFVDAVAGLNNFTNTGTTNITGIIGDARNVADNQHMHKSNFADLPLGADDRTICMWIYPTDCTNAVYFFGYGGGTCGSFDFYCYTGNKVSMTFASCVAAITSVNSVKLNDWNFVCGVQDSGTQRLYINATEEVTSPRTLNTQNSTVYIGTMNRATTEEFRGRMDEVMMWNRSVGQPELEQIYLAMLDGNGYTSDFLPPPYFTLIPDDKTINYTQGFNVQFNGTDETDGEVGYYINWTTDFEIDNNGNLYNTTSNLAVGVYNIKITINNTDGGTNSTDYQLTVQKNSDVILGLTATTPIEYPTVSDFVGSGCPPNTDCTLNISNAIFGVGTTSANYSLTNNANYTDASATIDITINKGVPEGNLTSDLGWTINETQTVTIGLEEGNVGDGDVTYIVYRDGISKGTGEIIALPMGAYTYILNTTGGINWTANASMDFQTLTVLDNLNPDIAITDPSVNNTNSTDAGLDVNFTYYDTNIANCSWTEDFGSTNTSLASCDINITGETWSEGLNTVIVYAVDTSNNLNSSMISFTIDTIHPTIYEPQNLTDLVTFAWPVNSSWNFSASDPHLNQCYYNTTDHALTIVTCNSTIETAWSSGGNKTVRSCANDTFGFETCQIDYLYVYFVEETQTEDLDPVGEGVEVTFSFTVNLTDIPSTTAYLVLNNTNYAATTSQAGTDGYYFERSVVIPLGWGSSTGEVVDWNWIYNISGVVTDQETATTNITVYEMTISDNCTLYGEVILNLSLKDEEANTFLSPPSFNITDIQIDLKITSTEDTSISWEYANTWTNDADGSVAVCIPLEVLNKSTYTMDFTIGFSADDHVQEFYYLDNGTLDSNKQYNELTNVTIDLFDLLIADSTTFLFKFFDEDNLEVTDAIVHVFRKYIGDGIFREVERGKQDNNGETHLHLVEEDVIYYFRMSLNGIMLYTSSTYNAKCLSDPCQLELEASGEFKGFDEDDVWDIVNGTFAITENAATRTVTLTYALNNPSYMNLTILKYTNNPNTMEVVGSDQAYSTGGTLNIVIPQVAGNVTFIAAVYENGVLQDTEWVDFQLSGRDYFGATGVFMALLLLLTLTLMAAAEGEGTIIFSIIGMIVISLLSLIDLDYYALVGLICAGSILIWKIIKRRNGG